MKIAVVVMCSLIFISQKAYSQQVQWNLALDTRAGVSSNTLLVPFFGEWDRSYRPGFYGLVSPSTTLAFNDRNLSADLTGGGGFEAFTTDRDRLLGGFGVLNVRQRVHERVSLGLESGGSTIATSFNRENYWVQPTLSWSPTLFTRLTFKAGSSFRRYRNLDGEEENGKERSTRFDLYGLEFETWPSFRWQLKAGVYGDLDDPSGTLSLQASLQRLVTESFRLGLRAGMDQFSFQTATGTNGGPPAGPGGGGMVTAEETDRIFRAGINASYQFSRSISVFAGADQLRLDPSVSGETIQDYHTSAGFRFSFRPSSGGGMQARPDWRMDNEQVITLHLHYSGDGQLYMTGDFNDWEQPGIPLRRQSANRYVAELSLDAGGYEYKILLMEDGDETWIDFTDNTYTVADGFGGENGLVFIE